MYLVPLILVQLDEKSYHLLTAFRLMKHIISQDYPNAIYNYRFASFIAPLCAIAPPPLDVPFVSSAQKQIK